MLFLTATPTVGGNGDALISAAMEEAKEHGAKVHLIHIREKRIGFCRACYGCSQTGVCVQKDDFMDILRLAMKRMPLSRKPRFIITVWQRR